MQVEKSCRVLVTGAGSGVGQGIVKALRISDLPVTIVSADISPMNAGLYRTEEALIIPKVECPGALGKIIELLKENQIQVVMIGSEFDLEFFSKNQNTIQKESGARVIVSPPRTVAIADDKWLTAEFLRENNLPYAESAIPCDIESALVVACKWGFPVILKDRKGTSSRHVYIIECENELQELWSVTPNPMLQKMVDVPSSELNNEYTCSVFKTNSGEILGPFHARRTLRGGTSWQVEVRNFPELNDLLLGIGAKLCFEGSLNIQLMIGPFGPIPFEFNARFSGTTAVRAHFGFNEPALALQSFYYGDNPEPPVIREGVAMRYHEEVFVENVSASDLTPNVNTGRVRSWF